jgi:transcriptional regulator with GAF, ATPase, and Fis domain
VVLGETSCIDVGDLPPEIVCPDARTGETAAAPAAESPVAASEPPAGPVIRERSWEEHEKAKISEALERSNGNITRAAQLLGMTFRTLQYRLEKFGIKKSTG